MKVSPLKKGETFSYKPLPASYIVWQFFYDGMNLGNTDFPLYFYRPLKQK